MTPLPPIPGWESMHPLVIHFPIVLLLLSPLFVLVSALLPALKGRTYLTIGLVLLLTGVASAYLAMETGEAAAELAERTPAINAALQAHEGLASQTRMVFSVLSVILIGLFALPYLLRRPLTRLHSTALPLIFLALYSTGVVALLNTAHQGGRLVHQYGVHAMLPAEHEAASASVHHGD